MKDVRLLHKISNIDPEDDSGVSSFLLIRISSILDGNVLKGVPDLRVIVYWG